jgi:hypothetical protein
VNVEEFGSLGFDKLTIDKQLCGWLNGEHAMQDKDWQQERGREREKKTHRRAEGSAVQRGEQARSLVAKTTKHLNVASILQKFSVTECFEENHKH